MVPAHSHKVSRVSWYSGSCHARSPFVYGAFTLSGWLSQNHSTRLTRQSCSPNPGVHALRFGLFRVRSPLLTESHVVFSSSGYLDVSVHRVPFHTLWIGVWIPGVYPGGFPHSDTCGSQDICSYPQLFAAYHVLHRLLVPRHPPCALSCLTFPVLIAFKTGGSLAVSFHRVYNVMSSYCFDSLSLKDNSSDVSFSYL